MNDSQKERVLVRLEEFTCRRCNECCRQPGYVYLADGEAERIAASLELELYDFTGRYTDLVDRRRLVLKKASGGEDCIFLTPDGCSVHAAKPKQCRDFPSAWRTQRSFDYCQGLRALKETV